MKPIIFIPGIMGTALANINTFAFDLVWNGYDSIITSIGTGLLGTYIEEKLEIDQDFDVGDETVIRRDHIQRLPYEKTISNLKQALHDPKKTLQDPIFLFGYDWRKSCDWNSIALSVFLDYLKRKLKNRNLEGFRFLTHSMGGLVFLCYLSRITQVEFKYIDKVVLTVPPFMGSPYALMHMVKGSTFAQGLIGDVFGHDEDVRTVVRTYPSLYELLPWYPHAITFAEDGNDVDLLQIEEWQSNISHDIPDLLSNRLVLLKDFREKFFDFKHCPESNKEKFLIIIGKGTEDNDTITGLKVQKEHKPVSNFVKLDELIFGYGDGTVPYESASCYKKNLRTLSVIKKGLIGEPYDYRFHGLFLRDSRVQNIIQSYFSTDSIDPDPKHEGLNWWQSLGEDVTLESGEDDDLSIHDTVSEKIIL